MYSFSDWEASHLGSLGFWRMIAVAHESSLFVDLLDTLLLILFDETRVTSHHKHELLPQQLILLHPLHSQLGLLDIVDDPLVVVLTDVLLEVKLDTRNHRVFFELDRVVVEEVEQPEVGHLLPVLDEVLPPDGDGMHELHTALAFLDDDQTGVGGLLGEEIVNNEVEYMLRALILLERKCSYLVEREGHVIDQSKILEVSWRDSTFDLEVDCLFLGPLTSHGHESDHLLSCGKKGKTNGSIHSVDETVISVLILAILEEDLR